jgi:DNA-binding protein YbaB
MQQRQERGQLGREREKGNLNQAKKDANQCQKDLKKAAKTLTNKRNKTSRKQKSLEKLKKRQKNKKQRKQKSKAEVKKELVAGQCVADHVCATIRGDPHITTFDGLKYDCQGEGEFVLAKTINSDNYFEIQARFTSIGKDRMVSITTAVSITTGVIGEPDVDIFTEKVDGECALYYFVDGQPTDFTTPVSGISFEDGEGSSDTSDYLFFTGSGIMYSVYAKNGNFGCVINSKLCLPPSMVEKEDIVGLLGTPDGLIKNEWTTPTGAELSQSNTDKATAYAMCTKNWCVRKAEDSVFGYLPGTQWADFYNCDAPYDSSGDVVLLDPPDECVVCCSDHPVVEMYDECIEECSMANEGFGTEQCVIDIEDSVVLATVEKKCKDPVIPDEPLEERTISFPAPPKDAPTPAPAPSPASGSGDPHFKTWSGDKFDYHGECDLVLVQNPDFASGMGLHIHIRTTRVKYFSYIESIAIMIGGKVLEFNNDVANFKISGKPVEPIRKYHETKIAGFVIRRDPKAISIRLDAESGARIDLIQRSNGFPAVVLDGGDDQILFKGSLGLLGDWETGKRLARDGKTEMMDEDATEFALEWQVRDTDPKLFWTPRFPQWPTQCLPPKKMLGNRLGLSHVKAEAEKACAHWKDDMDDCIFDVIATRNVLVAAEGSVTSM